MVPLDQKLNDWTRHRRRLELETRLLVVEDEPAIREQLDDLLYRQHVSSRSVETTEQTMELLGGAYPVLLVSENLSGLGGLHLLRHVRRSHPAVDALLSSWEPSLELYSKAFDLRLLDIVRKPLPERQVFGEQIRSAVRRNVDRRMRRFLVQELHETLEQLPEGIRATTTRLLEERLNAFKGSLGAFNRVLIVEQDDADLRLLGENLLLAGMHVETTLVLEQAIAQAERGEVHMVALHSDGPEPELRALISQLRVANPVLDVLLVSSKPDVERARTALLLEAVGYLAWPPSSVTGLVGRVQNILRRSRRDRLLDNLVVELFRETSRALGQDTAGTVFQRFCELLGLDRVMPAAPEPSAATAGGEAVEYLGDVLDSLLAPDEQVIITDGSHPEIPVEPLTDEGAERRVYPRVVESQFVRFRPKLIPASTLALVGDVSEGGLFIRTGELLLPGTLLEVEFQVAHEGQGYMVCCKGQVAWVARDNKQSPLGPGFGVKFLDAPEDVVELLKKIVCNRIREPA